MNQLDFFRKGSNDMNALMDNFFRGEFPWAVTPQMEKAISAKCEISETPTAYNLKFEVPGLKKEDIRIDLHDNRLVVSGEKKSERKDEKIHYSEFSYGSFVRSYTFPTKVNPEKVDAKYDGGILRIEVAKTTEAPARTISVK